MIIVKFRSYIPIIQSSKFDGICRAQLVEWENMADLAHFEAIYSAAADDADIIERISTTSTIEVATPDPVIIRGAGSTTM